MSALMCEAIGSLLSGLEQPKTQEAAERTGQVGLIHVGDDLRDPERERMRDRGREEKV